MFVLTDIEGSTRMWDLAPADMTTALARHDEIIVDVVQRFGGNVVKARGEGDSAFCVFPDATSAVRAVLELQLEVSREPWPHAAQIRVRAGVHSGPAEERDGDYYGDTINRCARLRGAAHGGQMLVTDSILSTAALPENVRVRDLGVHRLRDLSKPERVYQLCHPELDMEFPPIVTLDVQRHNLPAQTTSFVGRDADTNTIANLFDRARLVTLTGAGGSGKTRLALHVGGELVARYPDGVWLVECAPLTDTDGIAPAIVAALGVRDDPARTAEQLLLDHLRDKRALLLLDNCEHLVNGCAHLVATLLRSSADLHVLTTSRELLGVPGEAVHHVSPLTLPDEGAHSSDSERLFLDRLAHDTEDLAAVADICRQLDGIPLAIELAAAKASMLGVVDVRERLADRFAILTGGSRIAVGRHKTLRATIDWSFDLLSAPERALLARLSVFVGGWTAASAEAIASDVTIPDVLEALSGLVSKSMCESDRAGRFRMLETILEYAQEKLLHWGETQHVRALHLSWARELIERTSRRFCTEREPDALNELETEWPNIRAAFDWALRCGNIDEALSMSVAISHFWEMHGHWTEGIALADRILSATPEGPDRAPLLIVASRLQQDAGDIDLAQRYAEEALHAAKDEAARASARYELGAISVHQGAAGTAEQHLDETLATRRRTGDTQGIAQALVQMAYVRTTQDRFHDAELILHEALTLFRSHGNKQGISWALTSLSATAAHFGDIELSRRRNEEALEMRRDIGDLNGVADSLTNLGGLWASMGDLDHWLDCAEQAYSIYHRIGARGGVIWSTRNLGVARLRTGDIKAGARLLIDYLERIAPDRGQMAAVTAANLAEVADAWGDAALAVRCHGYASAYADLLREQGSISESMERVLDRARATLGDDAFAIAWREGEALDTAGLAAAFRATIGDDTTDDRV